MLRRLTRERYLTDAELARFMAAVRERRHVHQPRDHALFALLANTGIRPSEALALTPADMDLSGLEPWIRIARLKKKVAQVDELQIPAELAAIVRVHLEAVAPPRDGRVFLVDRRQAQRLFHYYAALAGIRRRLWLYCLRHTAATRIYRATRDIRTVQTILGHERPDMSCIYAHVGRAIMRQTLAAVPAVT